MEIKKSGWEQPDSKDHVRLYDESYTRRLYLRIDIIIPIIETDASTCDVFMYVLRYFMRVL